MTEFKDKTIVCADCGQVFAVTADELAFYSTKNLPEPQYCLICRGKYMAQQKDLHRHGRQKDIARKLNENC